MKINDKTVYVSVDIEADGPIPGPNSMLSLGAVAFTIDVTEENTVPEQVFTEKGQFQANLDCLEDAVPDVDTMAFWGRNPQAYAETRKDTRSPKVVMERFSNWLSFLGSKPVFVGYPATYDFLFVYWYLIKFTGHSPFGFQGLDIKTLAWSQLDTTFHNTAKKHFPKKWFRGIEGPHSHVAVEDAREQARLFYNIVSDR